MLLRSLARRLHLCFGLSISFLLALLGLTGAALVFYIEIDAALHPAEPIPADEVGSPPDWQSPLRDTVLATARRERSRTGVALQRRPRVPYAAP